MDYLNEPNVPDGEYCVEIIAVEAKIDSKSRNVVEWLLRVVSGPHDQKIIRKPFYIVNKKSADFLKKELKMLEIEVKDSADFMEKKQLLVGKKMKITAKTNEHGFQVYYVKSGIDLDNLPAVDPKKVFGW